MAKIYTEPSKINPKGLNPKKETVDFLLNYSKSLAVVKSTKFVVEINKN